MSFLKKLFKRAPISIQQTFSKKENFRLFVKKEVDKALSKEKDEDIEALIKKHSFEPSLMKNDALWRLLLGDGYEKYLCHHIPTLLSARFGGVFIKAEPSNTSMVEFMMIALGEMNRLTYEQTRFLRENMHLPSVVIDGVEVFMNDDMIRGHAAKQVMVALEMDRRRDPEKRGVDVDEIHNRKMNFFNMSHCILQTIK